MSRPSTCHSCRHWQQLSKRAVIGRCTEQLDDPGYTNRVHRCRRHALVSCTTPRGRDLLAELRARNAELLQTTRSLSARTATNAEITRQLAAEMKAALQGGRHTRQNRKPS